MVRMLCENGAFLEGHFWDGCLVHGKGALEEYLLGRAHKKYALWE